MKHFFESLLFASILTLVACSKGSGPAPTGSAPETRPVPELNKVQEVTLWAGNDILFFSYYDRKYNLSVLRTAVRQTTHGVVIQKQNGPFMQPVLMENYAGSGAGGLLRYADSGELENITLEHAVSAIQTKGVVPTQKLLSGANTVDDAAKLVDAAGFTPGSIWILSVHDRGEYILAIQLGEEFVPSDEIDRQVKFRYKILKFEPQSKY